MRRVGVGISGKSGSTSTAAAWVVLRQARIAGIGYEGDFGRAGLFNSFDTCDFDLCVSAQFRAQPVCQFA